MKDVFMFCENPECVQCAKRDMCCQDCAERNRCDNKCESLRYKEKIYSSNEFLIDQLEALAEATDNWLIAVAAEKIKSLQYQPPQHKRPASKYACPYCQGGRIEIEGPGMESYASSCPHCHGSGERMIEIPLREYERLVQRR